MLYILSYFQNKIKKVCRLWVLEKNVQRKRCGPQGDEVKGDWSWHNEQVHDSYRSPNTIKKNQSHYRPEVPRGFQEVKVPRLHDSGRGWW